MLDRSSTSEKRAWLLVAVFSAVINILMLTGSLYMVQIYDRVLAGGSIPTLVGITLLALAAYALLGVLEHVRGAMLGRIGASVDARLSHHVFRAAITGPADGAQAPAAPRLVGDLDAIRACISGPGPAAVLDLPFTPLFLAVCFLLHPLLALVAGLALAAVLALAWMVERATARPASELAASSESERRAIENARRHSEPILAMGLGPAVASQHLVLREALLRGICKLADSSMGPSSFARTFRLVIQSAVLGLGAVLVIRGELSAGSMLAASVLSSRALAPVELLLVHLKGLVAGWHAWNSILAQVPQARETPPVPCPQPPQERAPGLAVTGLGSAPSLRHAAIVRDIDLTLRPGELLVLTGASGSGKSSLLRALAGAWPVLSGTVDLRAAGRAPVVSYLPQDIELFPATIAQNIARLARAPRSADILAAAMAAHAHELIVALPDGYETRVGEGGSQLSAGQLQRIGLARALYGDPDLLLFDEPDANLDGPGKAALVETLDRLRGRGAMVVVATHGSDLLARADSIGRMDRGALVDLQATGRAPVVPSPLPVRLPDAALPSGAGERLSIRALRSRFAPSAPLVPG